MGTPWVTPEAMPPPRRRGVEIVLGIAVIYVALIAGAFALGARSNNGPGAVGPYAIDDRDPANPHNQDAHWHAALGVYDCDHWMSDGTGAGAWHWPAITPSGGPGQLDNPRAYAGLHSHDDGVIHMEPDSAADAGENATLGRYFKYGGWELTDTGFDFLGTTRHAGDRCGTEAGVLRWWVNGREQSGDPADYKLFDGDVVAVAFVPADAPTSRPAALARPDARHRIGLTHFLVRLWSSIFEFYRRPTHLGQWRYG